MFDPDTLINNKMRQIEKKFKKGENMEEKGLVVGEGLKHP